MKADLVVVGAGPAGLAAALKAWNEGVRDIYLLERDLELGGILPQCIHDGFGTITFKESLTGPEYAQRYIDMLMKTGVKIKLNTMVLSITPEKNVTAVSSDDGILEIDTKAIILAMGCRERTRFQIMIRGDRPAGIFTAGTAQRFVNIEGYSPGKKIVVVGSGDVGLIMARRFTLEGAEVEGVYEIMPYPGGLNRNVTQCLQDYNIPLHLSHTVIDIKGRNRVEGVTVAKVNEHMKPIKGTDCFIPCDTIILAVGLIPETELLKRMGVQLEEATGGPTVNEWMETSIQGVFACGNVVHVNDIVDYVTESAETAGISAARYVKHKLERRKKPIKIELGRNIRYVVPQLISEKRLEGKAIFYLRVKNPEKKIDVKALARQDTVFVKKSRVVRPSEMVRLEIPAENLNKAEEYCQLTFEVKSEQT
jgi:NADPH-dependent 2,4-dienoyl-CoA reductase/sulfur reductase-like enzyme